MGKTQINFRASDLTREQLDWLQERWGTSQTETVTVAIDRVYQAERGGQDLDAGGELPEQAETPALYELLNDAAAAIVREPAGRWDRDAALARFTQELVLAGLGAGLSLGDLRALAVSLQNELTDAIAREAAQAEPAAG